MEKLYELKFIDHIGEINSSTIENLTIEAVKCEEREYEFFISILKTCRIFACRFSLCQNSMLVKETVSNTRKEQLSILIKYWKAFYLPFYLVDFALTKEGIWVLGETRYSNIKSYLSKHLSNDYPEDSLMDTDEDEFKQKTFETKINLPSALEHNISSEKFYLKCDSFNHKIVLGSNDGNKLQLNIISSSYEPLIDAELSDIRQLLEVQTKPPVRELSCEEESESRCLIKPVLILCPVHHVESKSNVLCKLLGSSFPCKNCVGFVSQPDHRIFYFMCSWPVEVNALVSSIKLKEIYDMKQPVLGIHVIQNIGGIRGTNVLLVGSSGKIVCLSSRNVAVNGRSEQISIENVTLYATSFELSSSVQQHVIFKDNVLFLSPEGSLYCSKFYAKEFKGTLTLVLSERCTLLQKVKKFILLDEDTGLFLILTKSGLLNLFEFHEKSEDETALSLPALMNQAMLISSHLRELNATKSVQSRFFEAVSIFASLKFRGIKDMKIHFTYSIKNVKNPPRKFIFVDIKGLERYKLESEFWVLSATASSRFEKNSPVLSKTVPFDSENPSICLEIDESIFRTWDSSPHPFILELGFILTLPEKFKHLDCFKFIKRELPVYCRAKELILDELSFMEVELKRSVKRLKTSHFCFGDQLTKDIFELSKKRTIYQLLRPEPQNSIHFASSFKLCMLQSTAEKVILLDTSDADFPVQWLQGVIRKAIQDKTSVFDVKCKSKTASITISLLNNHLIFNIHSEEFNFLAGLKIAIANVLVKLQDLTGKMDACVFEVSPELRNDCEELSKELKALSEQDVEKDFSELLNLKYKHLRTISSKLIYC